MTNRSFFSAVISFTMLFVPSVPAWFAESGLKRYGVDEMVFGSFERLMPTVAPIIYELLIITLYGAPFYGVGMLTYWWLYSRRPRKKQEAQVEAHKRFIATQFIGFDCRRLHESLERWDLPDNAPVNPNVRARIYSALKELQALGVLTPLDRGIKDFPPSYILEYLYEVTPYLIEGVLDEAKVRAARFLDSPHQTTDNNKIYRLPAIK